jgi:hypothetical protein
VPGSGSPAASRPAQGSPSAESERALPIRAGGPAVSTAPLSPPGPAGSSKPMTASIPPPAAPGPASAERPGSCREQPTRALLADAVPEPAAPATAITSSIAGPQRAAVGSTPGWPGWLATQASSPEYAGQQNGTYCRTRAVCQVPEDKMTEKSGRLPRPLPHHTRRSQGRLPAAGCRVIEDSCRTCPYPPQTLRLWSLPGTG